MGQTLTVASTLQCPHGGGVQIISANVRVKIDNAYAALTTDQFVVSACPFQIPIGTGTIPSPCLTVQWVLSDLRNKAAAQTLSTTSVGLCLNAQQVPQGTAVIANAQARGKSQ